MITEKEAIRQGLRYSGIAFLTGSPNEDICRKEVEGIKKKYKVRAVLVERSKGWKAYYVDDDFSLIHLEPERSLMRKLSEFPERYEVLKKKYEAEMQRLMADEEELEVKLKRVRQLKRKEALG